jgi:hypothetical protein
VSRLMKSSRFIVQDRECGEKVPRDQTVVRSIH